MRISKVDPKSPRAVDVKVSRQALTVELADGRTLLIPLAWYPRLFHARPVERARWRLIGGGEGIHWPDLDEDVSVNGLLAGLPSGESQASLQRWLEGRSPRRSKPVPQRVGAGQVRDGGRRASRSAH